jgi:hypothetical protein
VQPPNGEKERLRMLPLLLMLLIVLLLGSIVVLCYLYLRCGLGRPRRRRWSAGYPDERATQEVDGDRFLYLKALDDETSQAARRLLLVLLITVLTTGLFIALLLNALLP